MFGIPDVRPVSEKVKSHMEQMREFILDNVPKEPVSVWSEDLTPKNNTTLTFDADKFDEWTRSLLPPRMAKLPLGEMYSVGDNLFRFRPLPLILTTFRMFSHAPSGVMRSYLSMGPRRGICRFTREVGIPQLIEKNHSVWMALTPMEVLTQRPGLKKAKGKVLIGGLGMGWQARRVCERKTVESVTVYEINEAVAKEFAFEHPKLKIVTGNVWIADPMQYDSILLDIWNGYGSASGTPQLEAWKKIHKRIWAWGDVGDWALDHSRF